MPSFIVTLVRMLILTKLSLSADPFCHYGIIAEYSGNSICCVSSCGICKEDNDCGNRGGSSNCCPSSIHYGANNCANSNAPCKGVSTYLPTTATASPAASTNSPTLFTAPPTETTASPTSSTNAPTSSTNSPTFITAQPTENTKSPTSSSNAPTSYTNSPTSAPSSSSPTYSPTIFPSDSIPPTNHPSITPSTNPTRTPSEVIPPSTSPSNVPIETLSMPLIPSQSPSETKSLQPSRSPSKLPTTHPSTSSPTMRPTKSPTITDFVMTTQQISTTAVNITKMNLTDFEPKEESEDIILRITYIEITVALSILLCICIMLTMIVLLYVSRRNSSRNKENAVSESVKPDHDKKDQKGDLQLSVQKAMEQELERVKAPSIVIVNSVSPSSNSLYFQRQHEGCKMAEPIQSDFEDSTSDSHSLIYDNHTMSSGNMITLGNFTCTGNSVDEKMESLRIWVNNVLKLPQYYQIFVDNGYDSCDMIKAIEFESELEEIGITSQQHQVMIMAQIREL